MDLCAYLPGVGIALGTARPSIQTPIVCKIKQIILKLRWHTCFSGIKYGKNCEMGGSHGVVCEVLGLLDVTYHW